MCVCVKCKNPCLINSSLTAIFRVGLLQAGSCSCSWSERGSSWKTRRGRTRCDVTPALCWTAVVSVSTSYHRVVFSADNQKILEKCVLAFAVSTCDPLRFGFLHVCARVCVCVQSTVSNYQRRSGPRFQLSSSKVHLYSPAVCTQTTTFYL